MKKAWIAYTVASVILFMTCLIIVIFYNKPVLNNFWEEALLIVAVANVGLAFSYYNRHKKETDSGWKMK
jgi:UDP-N-acetylmuramyl pentapeptide phosphotransferase/UDP-N-acetylglucosamine-1-phosphate transferase